MGCCGLIASHTAGVWLQKVPLMYLEGEMLKPAVVVSWV